jgi:hypothetical protein
MPWVFAYPPKFFAPVHSQHPDSRLILILLSILLLRYSTWFAGLRVTLRVVLETFIEHDLEQYDPLLPFILQGCTKKGFPHCLHICSIVLRGTCAPFNFEIH